MLRRCETPDILTLPGSRIGHPPGRRKCLHASLQALTAHVHAQQRHGASQHSGKGQNREQQAGRHRYTSRSAVTQARSSPKYSSLEKKPGRVADDW